MYIRWPYTSDTTVGDQQHCWIYMLLKKSIVEVTYYFYNLIEFPKYDPNTNEKHIFQHIPEQNLQTPHLEYSLIDGTWLHGFNNYASFNPTEKICKPGSLMQLKPTHREVLLARRTKPLDLFWFVGFSDLSLPHLQMYNRMRWVNSGPMTLFSLTLGHVSVAHLSDQIPHTLCRDYSVHQHSPSARDIGDVHPP